MATQTTSEREQLMKAEELADRWQVKENHVYRLARDGKIPVVKVGRYTRFRRQMIEAYERGEWTPEEGH